MKEFRTMYLRDVVEVIEKDDINTLIVRGKEFVQVVRCKDCQNFHRRQSMFGKEYTECDLYCAMQPTENDFCSRGKFKDVQRIE